MVNYDLLCENIKFPLKLDTFGSYVWDSDSEMVADFIHAEKLGPINKSRVLFTNKVCGDMKIFENTIEPTYELVDGDFININTKESVGRVRGWGNFQYEVNSKGERVYNPERGELIMQSLELYLLSCLNN